MKRNETIDLIKGLGILLVVLGHAGSPCKSYIYLFHMPIFFMASGFCYNIRNSESTGTLGKYFGKKLSGLYVPYVLFNAVLWLLHNKLIDWNIYTDNPAFSSPMKRMTWTEIWARLNHCLHFNPGGTQQLCGADWFVLVLFYITLVFAFVCWFSLRFKNKRLQHLILPVSGIVALLVGYILQKKNVLLEGYWSPAITGYSLYVLGFYLNKLPVKVNQFLEKARYFVFVAGLILLYFAGQYGSVALNTNHFTDPFFLLGCSLVGWLWLQACAQILMKVQAAKQVLVYLSKSSLFILFLHMLAFKAVSAIQIAVYQEEAYMLASFPVLHSDGFWWVAYTVVGVCLPVAVKYLWDKLICLMKERFALTSET